MEMKVLQINSVCGYGSTGNIVVDLYRALKAQGDECCVAYGRGHAPENVQAYRIGSDRDVYVHGILSRLTDKHGFYSKRATKRFVQWMKVYDPDVIHLHNLHGYYINIEILFEVLKEMDKPVVWTLHDCWAFTGHCSHFEYIGCDKWKIECGHCPQKREYPASFLFDNSKKNYARKKAAICSLDKLVVVAPSRWLAETVRQSYLKNYPIDVIYNGIDLESFKPTESDFRKEYGLENKKIILGVSNVWSKRKGLQVFQQLARKLDENYQIVLVGITKKQSKRLDNGIIAIGRTSSKKELAQIYTAADVFLNPSEEETMGLTTVEALACGTNVLVNNSTALPEIVDYDAACILKGKNMLSQIIEISKWSDTREKNRKKAFLYEKKVQCQKYMSLYEKFLR